MADDEESVSKGSTGKGSSPSNRTPASVTNTEYAARDEDIQQTELQPNEFDVGEGTELVAVSAREAEQLDNDVPVYVENEAAAMLHPDVDEDEGFGQYKLTEVKGNNLASRAFVPKDAVDGGGETVIVDTTADGAMKYARARSTLPTSIEDISGTPTPGEWMSANEYAGRLKEHAQEAGLDPNSSDGDLKDTLSSGAQRSGDDEFSMRDDRMGGWPDFNREDVVKGENQNGARNVVEADYNGETVYFAEGDQADVAREQAGYRALESMGVDVPTHEFGQEGSTTWTVKQEFDGETIHDAPDEWIANADRNAGVDMFAANVVVGNWDIHDRNVMVNESGDIQVIDLDRAGDDIDTEQATGYENDIGSDVAFREAGFVADILDDPVKKDESDPYMNDTDSDGEVYQRAQQMSQNLIETGEYDRLVDDVASVDERAAKHIAKNIVTLATKTDNSGL